MTEDKNNKNNNFWYVLLGMAIGGETSYNMLFNHIPDDGALIGSLTDYTFDHLYITTMIMSAVAGGVCYQNNRTSTIIYFNN